jgi:hypothetical protein
MTDNKTSFATPNSSKLAQILLQLKEIDGVGESEVSGENTLHFSNAETVSYFYSGFVSFFFFEFQFSGIG